MLLPPHLGFTTQAPVAQLPVALGHHDRHVTQHMCSYRPPQVSKLASNGVFHLASQDNSVAGWVRHAVLRTLSGVKALNWCSSALAAPLRQPSAMDADMGSAKMSSSPFSTPSNIARAT